MKKAILFLLVSVCLAGLRAQDDGRSLLRGTVLYLNSPVPNENVINSTAGTATITDHKGEFAIPVQEGDELIFMALNYQLQIVRIDADILRRNRLVVEVNEKVTQLDEVTVRPEEQQEFLRLQNEDFRDYDYDTDETTEIENIALDETERGMKYGLNFVNIFKLLAGTLQSEGADPTAGLLPSAVIRQIFDDSFFVRDLNLSQDQIPDFLDHVDRQLPSRTLLRKDHEFELIDFLVTESEAYRRSLDED